MRSTSVVLLSGGLDSLASFVWAEEESDIVLAITFNYGQRAAAKEIESAQRICNKREMKHLVVDIPWFSSLKSLALLDKNTSLPQITEKDLDDLAVTLPSAKAVWVPNRNGVFLNIGASFAEDLLANWIITGFNKEEGKTFPDNSEAFVEATSKALKYSTDGKVSVKAPMVGKTKKEIVEWMLERDVDLTHLWSCYLGEEKMCGVCESCLRCKRALKEGKASQWLAQLF